jgi:hypothetical protein
MYTIKAAFQDGLEAYHSGFAYENVPVFFSPEKKGAWQAGWLDAQRRSEYDEREALNT